MTRPEWIESAMGDRVFDGDEGHDELLESLRSQREVAERLQTMNATMREVAAAGGDQLAQMDAAVEQCLTCAKNEA